jgi:hypothetical protein
MRRLALVSLLISVAIATGCIGKGTAAKAADPNAAHGNIAPVAMFGLVGHKLVALHAKDLEYSEGIFLQYSQSIDIDAFKAGLTVTPQTAVSVELPFIDLSTMNPRPHIAPGAGPAIHLQTVPGQTYRITQRDFGIDLTVTTPHLSLESIPQPIRHVKSSYYYGLLSHPWGGFLGGLVYANLGDKIPDLKRDQLDQATKLVHEIGESGAGFVRMDFCGDQSLGHVSQYPTPRFAQYDAIIEALAAVHVTVLPEILVNCAPLYLINASDNGRSYAEPTGYATWAGAVAEHLRKYPQIKRVELFNEPNLRGGWRPGETSKYAGRGDGDALAPFMKAAYAAVKAANSKLMVVSGAFSTGGRHLDSRVVLANAYAAGCRTGVCWDELSVHNYRWSSPLEATIGNDEREENRFDIYKDLQLISVAHGDPKPKVMLTEWGYSSCATLTLCFNPLVQALYLAQGLNLALADPSVDGIVYVNLRNASKDGPNFFWSSTSLLNNDYSRKPAYEVFKTFNKGSRD